MPSAATRQNPRNAGPRRDPAPRRVDRSAAWGGIKNADPEKDYVWVYKASAHGGVGYYENLGYDVETVRSNGVKSLSARKNVAEGQPIEFMDNVLMSRPKALSQEDYEAGQAEVDEMEARIISKGGGVDSLRGISGIRGRDGAPVLGFENKTTGPQAELE